MSKGWLINAILFCCIIGLLLACYQAFWIEPPPTSSAPPVPALTNVLPQQVSDITIQQAEKLPMRLQKTADNQWWLQSPLELPVHPFQVTNLLNLLTLKEYQRLDVPFEPNKLAEFHLNPPLMTLQYGQLKFAIGEQVPMREQQRYLALQQNVYIVPDRISYLLNLHDIYPLVNLSPLALAKGIHTTSQWLSLKTPVYHLLKQNDHWQLSNSIAESSSLVKFGTDEFNRLIDIWNSLQALQVRATHLNEAQFLGEIELTFTNQQSLIFKIVSYSPQFVLAMPEKGIQYHFMAQQAKELLLQP